MSKTKFILPLLLPFLFSCSSAAPIKTQKYAELKESRVFEDDFFTVWKSLEAALDNYKITERDPEKDVNETELKKLKEGHLETDWVYSNSRDKYVEYKVNGLPRKKALQTRFKYEVEVESVMGGTEVKIDLVEEIEELKKDGSSAGFSTAPETDTSRANELLEKINQAILKRA